MNNQKDDKPMHAVAATDSDGNLRLQLSPKQAHNYTDRMVELGPAEYNKGSIS